MIKEMSDLERFVMTNMEKHFSILKTTSALLCLVMQILKVHKHTQQKKKNPPLT